ncbi:hypothetical protein FHG87_006172 [Trinorchestia longiramus]|nr:hypothetical protein FHG87_006172 [Trinorchestia longiramus]
MYPLTSQVDFSPHPDSNPESRQKLLLRFQLNPEKFWGPATRSSTKVLDKLTKLLERKLHLCRKISSFACVDELNHLMCQLLSARLLQEVASTLDGVLKKSSIIVRKHIPTYTRTFLRRVLPVL